MNLEKIFGGGGQKLQKEKSECVVFASIIASSIK
jgi:hypothetical protein